MTADRELMIEHHSTMPIVSILEDFSIKCNKYPKIFIKELVSVVCVNVILYLNHSPNRCHTKVVRSQATTPKVLNLREGSMHTTHNIVEQIANLLYN